LKTFGYAYCNIQNLALTYSGSAISSVALNPGQTITVTMALSYYIDDANTIFNMPFCAAGNTLEILNGSVPVDMTAVFLDPATLTATYTIPVRYHSWAFNEVYTFRSKDSRNTAAVWRTKTLNVAHGAC
jgi:hypothetical protein